MLGESPVHGFGETLEFKVELVHRLVQECHYNALFIESGMYDFVHIEALSATGRDVTDAMISSAIGGLWSNEEVQPLVPFLEEKMKTGSFVLRGLDDQIGRDSYASRGMSSDLVRYLFGDERSRCLGILQKHMGWQYSDDAPYGPTDKAKIVGCLEEIRGKLSQPEVKQQREAEEDKAMIASLERNLARNFTEDDFTKNDQEVKWDNDRDRSMYLNFKEQFSQLPRGSKVIVWAATVHLAKTLTNVNGFKGTVPFGFYIEKDFGDRAYALGFSAYSGEYAFVHQPVRQLDIAPDASLEGLAFAHNSFNEIFLSKKELQRYSSVAARPLGNRFESMRWDKVVDGLVVFRKEHAPAWLSH